MELRDLSNNINCYWCNSVDEIGPIKWGKIFGIDIIKHYNFFKAMEMSHFPRVKYRYLVIIKNEMIMSIVPCFIYDLDLLNLVSSHRAKWIIDKIRFIMPNIFKLKTFVTGSYAATCEHFIEYAPNLNPDEVSQFIKVLNEQLRKEYKETNSQIIFVKDIRERYISDVKKVFNKDFSFFISFPTTVIPIIKGDFKYPTALKKKNRKRYRTFKQKFAENFTWEILTDFEKYTPLLTELYQAVLSKAKNKFEILNETFFFNINKIFPESSYLLIARDKKGEIRLMEVILEDKDRLIPLYLGIKYKNDDTKILYLNAIFRTIEEAEIRGKDLVDFGQTSYYPKVMSGAMIENLYYGFWSDKFILKKLIRYAFKYIFAKTTYPENVYMDNCKEVVYRQLKDKGFVLTN